MRVYYNHPVKLGSKEQDSLVSQFKKEMLGKRGRERRESDDGALISYLKFNLWKRELLDAARERKEDARLRAAFAAWQALEVAVESFRY